MKLSENVQERFWRGSRRQDNRSAKRLVMPRNRALKLGPGKRTVIRKSESVTADERRAAL